MTMASQGCSILPCPGSPLRAAGRRERGVDGKKFMKTSGAWQCLIMVVVTMRRRRRRSIMRIAKMAADVGTF